MSNYPYRQDREELKELLLQYHNLKTGNSHSFIDEDAFEKIIDYFDEKDQLDQSLEAAEFAVEQYPYSSSLLLKKCDLLIASKKYKQALYFLDQAALLDNRDINLYILRTDALLALDQHSKAASVLETALEFDGHTSADVINRIKEWFHHV
jgi:tetratricopeptide (TPR) repeat protein